MANSSTDLATWDDTEFTINLRRRHRLRLADAGLTCTHMRRSARQQRQTASDAPDAACPATLDAYADHPIQCMIGFDHTAFHDAASDEIAKMHQQAGLRSRREVYIPQLATPKKIEPRADIVCWGPAALPVLRLDFTMVSPWASRNARTLLEAPAATAKKAEESKVVEYGAKGGMSVQASPSRQVAATALNSTPAFASSPASPAPAMGLWDGSLATTFGFGERASPFS